MTVLADFNETISLVESTPNCVPFKNLHAQRTFNVDSVINHCFAKSSPVEGWFKKQSSNLVSYKSNESDGYFIIFQYPRLGVWEMERPNVVFLLSHKGLFQKRVSKRTCRPPD